MKKTGLALLALTLTAPLAAPNPVAAAGALAVGSTGNVSADGIAIGSAYNYATRQDAIAHALARCHDFKPAPRAAAQCQIVGAYSRKCYAEALDPAAGTPGAGWAIGANKQAASRQAIANCRATAGVTRRNFCKIVETGCDTHN